ncbi:Uncharacterised protein [Bordetella pertussis]|nr:Uncharacterised protein [Bordetella pertussis]
MSTWACSSTCASSCVTTATRTRPGGQVAAMVCSMVPVGNPVRHSSSKPLGVKPCASDSR